MSDSIPMIGSMIWDGDYSVKNATEHRYGKLLKYFEYNYWEPEKENIVVFSDICIPQAAEPRFNGVKHKVAWMMEGPGVYRTWGHFIAVFDFLSNNLGLYTAVATCDDSLVEKYPGKFIYVPFGGIIVPKESSFIFSKSKMCSTTAGQLYSPRDLVYSTYKDSGKIDFLGSSFGQIARYDNIVDGFKNYRYHISIPNCAEDRYFSSNLTDPLACGTVPIWWGTKKLGDFFNMDGIIVVSSMGELDEAINRMSEDDYLRRMPAIKENHVLVEKYRTPENALWENVLSKLYGSI